MKWIDATQEVPDNKREVLCFDDSNRVKYPGSAPRYFIGACDYNHPSSHHIGERMWCDEECTYVTVTKWADFERVPLRNSI